MDKISVIVPVYNVEKYLHKCVDSILHQTYNNIEIILVDDGSVDGSSTICDDYFEKFPTKIVVMHIKNSGSSRARCLGIEKAVGNYISFVDADDFIEEDMIELLYNNIIKSNADISMCGHYIYDGEKTIEIVHNDGSYICYTNIEATAQILLDDKINSFLCDKLFKKSLFSDFEFSDLSYHEDFACVYKLFYKSNSVVVNNIPKYYYRRNYNSKSFNLNYNKKYDSFLAYSDRCNFIYSNLDNFRQCIAYNLNGLIECGICVLNLIIRSGNVDLEKEKISNVKLKIKKNLKYILVSKKLSFKIKIYSLLLKKFKLYQRIICLNKKKLTNYNIIYVSAFPNEYFRKIISKSKIGSQYCSQKLNYLLIDGLKNTNNLEVLVTEDPLRYEQARIYSKKMVIYENNTKFTFLPIYKIRIVGKYITNFYIKKYIRSKKRFNAKNVLIADILKPNLYPVYRYGKRMSYITVGIVTDLPTFFEKKVSGLINKYKLVREKRHTQYILKNTKKFVFITKYVAEKILCDPKDYIVMEGVTDEVTEAYDNKNIKRKNIIMYAGDLSKMYGLDRLIKAFIKCNLKNYELHLYGKCDYIDEMRKICKDNKLIKYFGFVDNAEIVKHQKECKFLVNPRPLGLDFNKFSFPSKLIEYMASGTPILTTKLEAISDEYDNYLNYTSGDTIEELKNSIEIILKKDYSKLLEKASNARNFVLSHQNTMIQSKRIIDLIEGNMYENTK